MIVGEQPIRAALLDYAQRILLLALILSAVTAVLVFFSLYFIFVRPMRRIAQAMIAFRANPEDASRIIAASKRRDEIGIAERELGAMQRDIFGFLQQKARLAALGAAVAKIQHDLRNILSSAQLASDRLAAVDDPVVQRLAPRLVASIDRAVALATNTLRYGRADETPPMRKRFALAPLIDEAGEAARASVSGKSVFTVNAVASDLEIDADGEQLYRIVLNLMRNAAEAVSEGGSIRVEAVRERRHVLIDIADDGPGIDKDVAARLFQPFASAARPGGTGLGLAIARDLARAHGGDVTLAETGAEGTRFRIDIPDRGELSMAWDPKIYLNFGEHRTRPAAELLARVDVETPEHVVDLGCGPGNSTALLAARWPEAEITGVDSSREMLAAARKSGVDAQWREADVAVWAPDEPHDVVFSNATLQWVPDHRTLVAAIDGMRGAGRHVRHAGAAQFQRAVPHVDSGGGEGQSPGRTSSRVFATGIMCSLRKSISTCWRPMRLRSISGRRSIVRCSKARMRCSTG